MYDEHEPKLAAELTAFEKQLGDLAPTVPRIDRDRLMYEAGEAAALAKSSSERWNAASGTRFWQATTAFATAASLILAVMLVRQHNSPQIADSAATFPDTSAVSDESHDSRTDRLARPDRPPPGYLGMRNVALTEGIRVFDRGARSTGITSEDAAPPANSRQLLKELLPVPEHPSS